MNLDPDDKFINNNCLEILNNKTKKENLDLIIYLIKRIPTNEREKKLTLKENEFQLQNEDYRITNKLIKRIIILKAYNYFKINIYGNKWNFHEDNIWNILVREYAKKTLNLSIFIYNYERNNESLNFQKGNLLEIKNRISRTKLFIKIIKKYKKNSFLYFYKYYKYYIGSIINSCNISLLKDFEIKKKIIDLSVEFLNIFKNYEIKKNINFIINKIYDNKIILFYNSYNMTIFNCLSYLSIFKILKENNNKKIISIDLNNITQINNIVKLIYYNDILVGFDNIITHKNFQLIINYYNKNKIILFVNNIYNHKIINNISLIKNTNIIIFYFLKKNIFNIFKKELIKNKLYFIPFSIFHIANYFNYRKNKKDIKAIIFYSNKKYYNKIKNQASNYFNSIKCINLKNKYLSTTYLIEIIKENEFILTDNVYIMELSALYFTSCILYRNSHIKSYNLIFKKLNYIKYIIKIKNLKKKLEIIKKTYNSIIFKIYDKYINKILKKFK